MGVMFQFTFSSIIYSPPQSQQYTVQQCCAVLSITVLCTSPWIQQYTVLLYSAVQHYSTVILWFLQVLKWFSYRQWLGLY